MVDLLMGLKKMTHEGTMLFIFILPYMVVDNGSAFLKSCEDLECEKQQSSKGTHVLELSL